MNNFTLSSAIKVFETKYPNHDFKWTTDNKRAIGICPFHTETHPSFNIFEHSGKYFYKCFACGKKGVITPNGIDKATPKKEIENDQQTAELLSEALHERLIKAVNSFAPDESAERAIQYLQERLRIEGTLLKNFLNEYVDIGFLDNKTDLKNINGKLKTEIASYVKDWNRWLTFTYRDFYGNVTAIRIRKIGTKEIYTLKATDNKGFFTRRPLMFTETDGIKSIFFVEGEFDATALDSSYMRTTEKTNSDILIVSVGGTSGYADNIIYATKQMDIPVFIAPDNDEAGKKALEKFAEKYPKAKTAIATIKSQYIKDFDELFIEAKDETEINDFLTDGLEYKELSDIKNQKNIIEVMDEVNNLPDTIREYYIKNKLTDAEASLIFETGITIKKALQTATKPHLNLLDGFILKRNSINILASLSATGKTYTALLLAIDFLKKHPSQKAFCWFAEDDKQEIAHRLDYLKPNVDILERLHIKTQAPTISFFTTSQSGVEPRLFLDFEAIIKSTNVGFIVLDPISIFLQDAPENDNGKIRKALSFFANLSSKTETTILFTHHTRKDSAVDVGDIAKKLDTNDMSDITQKAIELKDRVRGASAIIDYARIVYFLLSSKKDPALKYALRIKANSLSIGDVIKIHLPFEKKQESEVAGNVPETF